MDRRWTSHARLARLWRNGTILAGYRLQDEYSRVRRVEWLEDRMIDR